MRKSFRLDFQNFQQTSGGKREENRPLQPEKPVVAIGNFDGGHLGHKAVVSAARALSGSDAAYALTFAPHPRAYFRPEVPFFALSQPELRSSHLARIGFSGAFTLGFDAELAAMSAEDFVREILVETLNCAGVAVGQDFHFGKGRAGTPQFLVEAGARHGFSVALVPPARMPDGTVISSSAIRAALAAGEIPAANAMLGRAYAVIGPILHGRKEGRTLGYPTANMALDAANGLKHGVYAVEALINGAAHPAVASFGTRPMFDNGAALLETHVFDFAGDLYGKALEIRFHAYLRAEMRFETLDALIHQMDADSAQARHLLSLV